MYSVMVVDDQGYVREKIRRMKIWGEASGFEIRCEASDGHEAALRFAAEPVDLVLTDIRMPKMDGIELLRDLSARPNAPFTAMMSDYSDFSYARECMKLGSFDYLLKPVGEDELSRVLADAAKRLAQRREDVERIRAMELRLAERQAGAHRDDLAVRIASLLDGEEAAFEEACEMLESVHRAATADGASTGVIFLQRFWQEFTPLAVERHVWLPIFAGEDLHRFSTGIRPDGGRMLPGESLRALRELIRRIAPNERDEKIRAIREHVLANLGRDLSLDDISAHLHFNKSYISKHFKQKTGQTVNRYVQTLKMERAMLVLIRSDGRISDIASELGYGDADYFGRVFRKLTGMPPLEYRSKHAEDGA